MNAFYVMYPIEDIYIPDSVISIADATFGGCAYNPKRITISLPKDTYINLDMNDGNIYNFVRR